MTYLVKQKIRGHTYVYEAENFWDPEKKQSRQKRKYLGVWDEASGMIIPKVAERDVKTTKSLGPAYLLDSVGNEIQLRKKLSEAFGKDGDLILAVAMSRLLHQTSLKNLNHVLEDSFLPEMYSLKETFNSQWLSSFLERLSTKEAAMTTFYNSLIAGEDETLIFDITSLTSASRNIDWLEWEYNRDGLDLPQVNLGLVLSLNHHLPLYFKLFPGSISDVVTLKNLVAEINAISQATNRFGKTILLSATKRRWDEVLSLYRERDEVEKKFDDLKNELEAMPLRVQKIETLQGLLFIFFVSLIMRAVLLRKARKAELLDKKSIDEILMELAKLRAVKVGGKWRLTEISKKQRTILEKMKIGIPVEANLVIKRAGV